MLIAALISLTTSSSIDHVFNHVYPFASLQVRERFRNKLRDIPFARHGCLLWISYHRHVGQLSG